MAIDFGQMLNETKADRDKKLDDERVRADDKDRLDKEYAERSWAPLAPLVEEVRTAKSALLADGITIELIERREASIAHRTKPYFVVCFFRTQPRQSDGYRFQSKALVVGSDGSRVYFRVVSSASIERTATFTGTTSATLEEAAVKFEESFRHALADHIEERERWKVLGF